MLQSASCLDAGPGGNHSNPAESKKKTVTCNVVKLLLVKTMKPKGDFRRATKLL
jgi:hypothetical protein